MSATESPEADAATATRPSRSISLPSGWHWTRLGDYVENLDSRRVPVSSSDRTRRPGQFPYYGASGIIDSIDGYTHDGEFVLVGEDGANLLSRSKPIAFLERGKIWVNNHAHVLQCRAGHSNAYLAYYLNSIDLSPYVTGTAQPKLSQAMMNKIPVPVAPPERQWEIVAELEKQFSRLDEAVANLKRVAARLARYRAATLTEAFAVQPGWAVSSYGEVGVVTTGFTPPTSDEANFGGAIPFFKPTDLGAGENVVAARQYLSDRGLSRGRVLPANSVLVTCIGATIGKTGLARVACATNQQINAVSPDPAAVDPRFLYWWTVSPRGQEQIVSNASATTLPILNKSKFSALAVPLPPIAEQRRIVAEVDRRLFIVREVEAEINANMRRAQALRRAVLARAFSVGSEHA